MQVVGLRERTSSDLQVLCKVGDSLPGTLWEKWQFSLQQLAWFPIFQGAHVGGKSLDIAPNFRESQAYKAHPGITPTPLHLVTSGNELQELCVGWT